MKDFLTVGSSAEPEPNPLPFDLSPEEWLLVWRGEASPLPEFLSVEEWRLRLEDSRQRMNERDYPRLLDIPYGPESYAYNAVHSLCIELSLRSDAKHKSRPTALEKPASIHALPDANLALPKKRQGVLDAIKNIWGSPASIPAMAVIERDKRINAWLKVNGSPVSAKTIQRTLDEIAK